MRPRAKRLAQALASIWLLAACVTENVTTGEAIPRGSQKVPFDRIERDVPSLYIGMSQEQVLRLLGSPAEMDDSGDVWVYLPERYGVLVPARALRLEFRERALAEFGFRPIVLGTRL